MGARIVIAETDEALRRSLDQLLSHEGFSVSFSPLGARLEEYLVHAAPDLAILGAWIAGISAVEICRRLRSRPETVQLPVILLVPPGRDADRLAGLSAGADDCLVHPFQPVELVIRIRNLLRRLNPSLSEHKLVVGDLSLDRAAHRVHRRKREIKLGPTEYRLLEFMMQSPGKVYSRAELKASLWGKESEVDERAIDVHIGRLRKGIGLDADDTIIRTVRGAGYALGAD